MILRPYGVVIDGKLELGVELVMEGKTIAQIRPHTGIPENFVISPAFVNAHSHLEYRGLQDKMRAAAYWDWIREITQAKMGESEVKVRRDSITAAHENRRTGVALIGEHSDRPTAATALLSANLDGVIFQETITFFERDTRQAKIAAIRAKAVDQGKIIRRPIYLTPHAYHTVDRETLAEFGSSNKPISIHVAETELESQFTRDGSGQIGDFYRKFGFEAIQTGKDIVPTLKDLGLVRPGAQFVHCCDISAEDIESLAEGRVSIAHCPRSNTRLQCPAAPIREMLDAGIPVGLGMDSPASSGAIDMFAEMREALRVSTHRGKPITEQEVWMMATQGGAESLKFALPDLAPWEIREGLNTPLIKISLPGATTTLELIERGSPTIVSFA